MFATSSVHDECLRVMSIVVHVRVVDLDLVATLCAWNNDDAFTLHSHIWRIMYNDACYIYRDNTCEMYTMEYIAPCVSV